MTLSRRKSSESDPTFRKSTTGVSESTTDSDEDDRILLIYMSRFPRISDAQDFRSRKK